MNAFFDQLRAFGVGRLAAIFGLAAGAALALMYFSGGVGGGSTVLLYSGLSQEDATATAQVLDQANITYEVAEGGTAIYVPRAQADDARIRVSGNGAMRGATLGYEIFDRADSFGQTSFDQNMSAKRALEGELARQIQVMDIVTSARVLVVLPTRRLFAREQEPRSASVTLTTRGTLNAEQIRVIRNIIANGAGLPPNNISINDERGRMLASATEIGSTGSSLMNERQGEVEAELRQKILNVVEGVVGIGAARVQVTAELNRDRSNSHTTTYDPDGRVIASQNRSEDTTNERDTSNSGGVSASENLPDAGGSTAGEATALTTRENSQNDTQFALSMTETTASSEAGGIERLSVAVAVDGLLTTSEDGTVQWAPRSDAVLQQIRELVEGAMGYVNVTDGRQDALTVQQFEFARADPLAGTEATSGMSFTKNDIMRGVEILVLFVTSLLVIFLVARPLVKGASGTAMPAGLALAGAAGTGLPAGTPAAPVGLPVNTAVAPTALPSAGPGQIQDNRIDIAKIDGQVKASSVKKVAGIVEQHPEESISILRTWLHEG
ncbi:MAG: flagellar basal-body MS-ring/collar protein FliF [Maricaulis sp.]|nr:flagellar basal-body MS-ring/collar protein FliF [Maricaulis sp.]